MATTITRRSTMTPSRPKRRRRMDPYPMSIPPPSPRSPRPSKSSGSVARRVRSGGPGALGEDPPSDIVPPRLADHRAGGLHGQARARRPPAMSIGAPEEDARHPPPLEVFVRSLGLRLGRDDQPARHALGLAHARLEERLGLMQIGRAHV